MFVILSVAVEDSFAEALEDGVDVAQEFKEEAKELGGNAHSDRVYEFYNYDHAFAFFNLALMKGCDALQLDF
jgi:hypothetical protein